MVEGMVLVDLEGEKTNNPLIWANLKGSSYNLEGYDKGETYYPWEEGHQINNFFTHAIFWHILEGLAGNQMWCGVWQGRNRLKRQVDHWRKTHTEKQMMEGTLYVQVSLCPWSPVSISLECLDTRETPCKGSPYEDTCSLVPPTKLLSHQGPNVVMICFSLSIRDSSMCIDLRNMDSSKLGCTMRVRFPPTVCPIICQTKVLRIVFLLVECYLVYSCESVNPIYFFIGCYPCFFISCLTRVSLLQKDLPFTFWHPGGPILVSFLIPLRLLRTSRCFCLEWCVLWPCLYIPMCGGEGITCYSILRSS